MSEAVEEVRQALAQFQEYYTRRDAAQLEAFLQMLADEDLEVIGTNASTPGQDEWHLGKTSAREIFLGDWEGWGDVRLDVAGARIRANGETAWLSCAGTVQMRIEAEKNFADYLAFAQRYMETPGLSAEEKLLYILRGGNNTLYELRRGENFIWPLRFTAVLTRASSGSWTFQHMQFAFPTAYFPDVRVIPGV